MSTGVSSAAPRYAGFWKRFFANIIDSILTSLIIYGPAYAFGVIVGLTVEDADDALVVATIGGLLIGLAIPWIYWAISESSSSQATLGKRALGIKVTDYQGKKISFARASGRYWGKLISTLILLVGFIMVGFTARKQGLHDIMAGTLVVNKT